MDMMLLFLTGVTIGISGAMIPGPLTLFAASEVLRTNRFAGLKIVAGHIAIEFIFIIIILLGLQEFLSSNVFLTMASVVGGSALIVMGVILIVKAPKMTFLSKKTDTGFNKGLFIGGIVFSAISPGFLVWWATIGVSTLIRSLVFGVTGVIILTLGHWIADVGWYWSMSYALDKGKTRLNNGMCRNIIRFFSVLLIILGIHFFVNGIRADF
ncbi:MAG: LysE family transporter [Candidatus Omnitrophica bacterium]|nr:LysE family transporter [Candidatus Omnitrophota bacterium]